MSVRVKKVLVSHADPKDAKSPYAKLARDYKLDITFREFVEIKGERAPEFRKQNINPLDASAIIFTGKHPVDHFFRICKELRIEMPADMKYFCVSEATAKYLQKYITLRKRKLYVAKRAMSDLLELLKKHTKENYLYPSGDLPRPDLIEFLSKHEYNYRVAKIYETVTVDLKNMKPSGFDLICFFSPNTIQAMLENFPDYPTEQKLVAVFGKTTAKAAEDAGLRLDIQAPQPEAPSMTMAIENYLKANK